MEHLTVEANQLLCQFLQVWSPDALEGQRITISNTHVTIEVPDEQQTIPIGDLLQNVLDPMIEKCKEDLQREGIEIIPFPEYLEKDEETKLHFLLDFTTQPAFQCRKTNIRLETFYYLGEVLTVRGWRNADKKLIRNQYECRIARKIEKIAKRVYELFSVRGLAHLYTVEYICPTRLGQMKEEDFYQHLVKAA